MFLAVKLSKVTSIFIYCKVYLSGYVQKSVFLGCQLFSRYFLYLTTVFVHKTTFVKCIKYISIMP